VWIYQKAKSIKYLSIKYTKKYVRNDKFVHVLVVMAFFQFISFYFYLFFISIFAIFFSLTWNADISTCLKRSFKSFESHDTKKAINRSRFLQSYKIFTHIWLIHSFYCCCYLFSIYIFSFSLSMVVRN
jgi:hypothetical protein